MKTYLIFIILNAFFLSVKSQCYTCICQPYGAIGCESAKKICNDGSYDFCKCPKFITYTSTISAYIGSVTYTFDVEDIDQFISISITNPELIGVNIEVVGPFTFESVCEDLIPADEITFIDTISDTTITNLQLSNTPGRYYINISFSGLKWEGLCSGLNIDFSPDKSCIEEPCETCIGSFSPIPGEKYVISAWVKEEGASVTKTSYTYPQIKVNFELSAGGPTFVGPYTATGQIIDGWQKIEAEFEIPSNATNIEIELISGDGDVLFDDIRFFPFDASMKSFVYDPINMRLMAELDERHFATFYEYDEEGKLVRIKKETEKGVMTIQETKSNATK